jgi:F-type H+-transporting ATPase subunit a
MGRATMIVAVLLALLASAPARAAKDEHATSADHKSDTPTLEGREDKDPLEHVVDDYEWHLFDSFGRGHITLPHTTVEIGGRKVTLGLSKYMVLELIAAGLVLAIYIPLAQRLKSGDLPKGGWLNAFEVLLTFVRDDVAKPAIGHDADKYVPFLWTMFLFILFNNILGLIPFFGAATGSIYVTLGLALCVFFAIHGSGAAKMGVGPYALSMWPHFHLGVAGFFLELFVFLIEWMGVLVRNLVLAVRLFANMFAGHVVLATILIFIFVAWRAVEAEHLNPGMGWVITILSILGQVALSLLELFVAFLQAYIFTFLTSLFLGMAVHPEH